MNNAISAMQPAPKKAGFTLIELSIVLVIIGLIVGGVLVGQDLIRAAEVRAQISQIEKYNTAVNTFRGKFNAIPGDMAVSTASQFGFVTTSCGGTSGQRDGNGLIEAGAVSAGTITSGVLGATVVGIAGYENSLFWQDLSSSTGGNLIDGSITGMTCASFSLGASSSLNTALPAAKIGRGQYVSVYNAGGYNWYGLFGMSTITSMLPVSPTTPMTVLQAYNIDKKMDDGVANSGNVVAQYIAATTGTVTAAPSASSSTTSTCYETSDGAYSVNQNNGQGAYCALGFRFQ